MISLGEIFIYSIIFLILYFEVFLVATYLENRKIFIRSTTPKRINNFPTVTIIVPAWNEEKTLEQTILSLLNLDYPRELLKVFIVDDGSTDKTLSIAKSFEKNPQVKVFSKEGGGKHTGLNLGLENCQTELVGCLDADSFVEPDALKEIISYFEDPEVMAVTPSVQVHNPETLIQRMQSIEYMMGQFTRKVFSVLGGLYVTPGPFSVYRRSIFEKIGKFSEGFKTEDMEMAMRMQSNGMKIENAPNALVFTSTPKNLPTLYRQRVRWVTGFLRNVTFNYRHMLFSKKYGNLGVLTLPLGFISIFSALFFSILFVQKIAEYGYTKYLEYSALGFNISFGWPSFDWFSLNLESHRLLVYLVLLITLWFVFIGISMVKRKFWVSKDIIYFIFFYGLIAPFWLARSVVNLVISKDIRWR